MFEILSFTFIVTVIFLVVLCSLAVRIILEVSKVSLRIILNMCIGFISLFIANLIPFIEIPINWITMLVAGFGGIIGVSFLILLQLLGIF